jgi:crotonobetainyl-CoA:carnitine CoA-transferase CaiB-like acyl-CoA transferase
VSTAKTEPDKPGPLDGLRVLDFSHALAGPYCTLVLADYGAKIYKLESRDGGDMGRGWGPPFVEGQSSYFLGLNRGKAGISIDLKRPEGIDLCLRMIEKMDVLIENFRPGTMDRLGLGYAAAHARNPRLVYCSISGYGQNGPSRDDAAMDLIVQSSSGLLSVTGAEGGEPVRCGYSVADVTAGMFAIIGILMALRSRDKTGQGQFVDVSMLDSMIGAMTSNFMTYLGSDEPPRPMGTAFATIVPYRVFPAKDRDFAMAVGSEKLWVAFCKAIDRPDLAAHPDYATNILRVKNRGVLEAMLKELFRERPVRYWLERLRAEGIPASMVRNLREVAEDPQTAVRGMFAQMEHPVAGRHRVTGPPLKFSETPGELTTPAPLLGQHTREALAEVLGLDDKAINDLKNRGVIFDSPPGKTPAS